MADQATLFWIDDGRWQLVEPLLKQADGATSGPRSLEDRVALSGIVHVLMTGCAWRDCPAIYGGYLALVNRYKRLKHTRTLVDILTVLDVTVAPPRQLDIVLDNCGSASAATASAPPTRDGEVRTSPDVERNVALCGTGADGEGITARDVVAAHLRQIAALNGAEGIDGWIGEVVDWHLEFVERARVGYWVPGMLGSTDPVVQRAVSQFHLHQVKTIIDRLTVEAHKQRDALVKAIRCINHYARQPINNEVAKEALRSLRGRNDVPSVMTNHNSGAAFVDLGLAPSVKHQ